MTKDMLAKEARLRREEAATAKYKAQMQRRWNNADHNQGIPNGGWQAAGAA